MSLTDLWLHSRNQVDGKQIQQIIAFAGEGKLRDGNAASAEFRDFLFHVPSALLTQYLNQCLESAFTDSGLVLQDIVNQIGRRLGFKVTDGRYRGSSSQVGYDGIWEFLDGHAVIAEVKTTDAYQISLNTLAGYRRELINEGKISEDKSSVLIVIGREDRDTSSLEAQIRGSRHAWSIRLISVDALVRLMSLKEDVEDPKIIDRISAILIPREFTKLDDIIDLVFSTAEDVKPDEPGGADDADEAEETNARPVSFHDACIQRIERTLKQSLIKRSRTTYSSPDDSLRFTCAVSRPYGSREKSAFWFAFHPYQKVFLEQAATGGYAAFGCGSENTLVMIPLSDFSKWLDQMNTTENERRSYWHVSIFQDGNKLMLHRKRGAPRVDLTNYLVTE